VDTTPRTSDLGGEMQCVPAVAERLDLLRFDGFCQRVGT
jgi:hypothetical protein